MQVEVTHISILQLPVNKIWIMNLIITVMQTTVSSDTNNVCNADKEQNFDEAEIRDEMSYENAEISLWKLC